MHCQPYLSFSCSPYIFACINCGPTNYTSYYISSVFIDNMNLYQNFYKLTNDLRLGFSYMLGGSKYSRIRQKSRVARYTESLSRSRRNQTLFLTEN